MQRSTFAIVAAWAVLVLGACGPKQGVTNPETGLVGHPMSEGSLAGTWAMRTTFATIVPIPVLGDRPGGGSSTRLVHRTWDSKAHQYTDTFTRCTNAVTEVEGAKTILTDDTLSKLSAISYTSSAVHDDGTFLSDPVVDLMGVHGLPDPAATPLPTHTNYTEAPQSDWIWDEDGDGNPGVTVFMRGTLAADLYVCKRSIYTFDGTIVSDDRVQGLIRQQTSESNSVKSTVSWMEGEGSAKPDPDELKSWFDMIRLKDDATCDDVKAADADGRLVQTPPFAAPDAGP